MTQAAIELFDRDGYEQTSVAAIAEQAGVHARTFFRYFMSKEDVAFLDPTPGLESIAAVLAELPAGPSAWELLGEAFVRSAARQQPSDLELLRRQQRVVRATPLLAGREAAHYREWTDGIRTLLAEHLGMDADDRSLALTVAAGVAVVRMSNEWWIDCPGASLADLIREDFALVNVTRA